MTWLIAGVLVLVLAGAAASFLMRGKRLAAREALTQRRVEAYIETIRREHAQPGLVAMSDTELRDLLLSTAHTLRSARERNGWVLFGAAAVALLSAILIGTEEGTSGFGVALLVGAVAIYGLNEFLGRRMAGPLREKGLDAERLKVE